MRPQLGQTMELFKKLADWLTAKLEVERVSEAYQSGWVAGFRGGENPYALGYQERMEWEEGRADAELWRDWQW